ncbi:MAG TPA: RodZ domain-containing protein [bacterium]|nr:RodZ domain-containing protein [bacterium]
MSIGSDLKAARVARKIDLETISARTRIPPKYLEALEEDRFDVFPSQTYVTGFLRAYAKVVGMDQAELTRRFKAETRPQEIRIEPMNAEAELEKTLGWKPTLHRPPVFRPADEEEALQETLEEDFGENIQHEASVMRRRARLGRRFRSLQKFGRTALSVLAAALLAGGAYYGFKALPKWKLGTATAPESAAAPTGDGYTVPDKYQHLLLKALDRSWVLVTTDDGATRTQLALEAGQFKTFKALKNFRLRVGNAGGVVVQYNQTPLGVLGTTGQVVEVQLPPGPQGMRALSPDGTPDKNPD